MPSSTTETNPLTPDDMSAMIRAKARQINALAESLADIGTVFDVLGGAESHPLGSTQRQFAELRDDADLRLSQALRDLESLVGVRAMTSHSTDLLVDAACRARGDGHDALELMDRLHAVYGDERGNDGEVPPETLPDQFLWDLYHRVSALNDLADRFPGHMRHAARQMHGWPMIVSHHLDHTGEFKRIAEMLQLGASYPLNISPRRKRGGPTPILDYLEPLVWRLHVLKKILADTEDRRSKEDFSSRIKYIWWSPPEGSPTTEVLEILRKVPSMPEFSKATAAEWSLQIIVPYISAKHGEDPLTASIPFIRNIWAHRGVKSAATFHSHLHSAVTAFLTRRGRQH